MPIYQIKKPAGTFALGDLVASSAETLPPDAGRVRRVMPLRIAAWLASGHIVERKAPGRRAEKETPADG